MEVWSCFFGIPRRIFFTLVGSIVSDMERINTRKGTQSRVQCSKCYDNFYFFYLNVRGSLIIPMIFIFYLAVKTLMITNFVVKNKTSSWITNRLWVEHCYLGKKFKLYSNLGIPANKIKRFPYTTNKYLRDGVKIYLHLLVSHRLLHLKLSGTINVSK